MSQQPTRALAPEPGVMRCPGCRPLTGRFTARALRGQFDLGGRQKRPRSSQNALKGFGWPDALAGSNDG